MLRPDPCRSKIQGQLIRSGCSRPHAESGPFAPRLPTRSTSQGLKHSAFSVCSGLGVRPGFSVGRGYSSLFTRLGTSFEREAQNFTTFGRIDNGVAVAPGGGVLRVEPALVVCPG